MGCSTSRTHEINPPNIRKMAGNSPSLNNDNDNEEFIENIVCKYSDINENEMKTFKLSDDDGFNVLVIKQNGILSALGTKCTHYGAPLVNGVLGNGRIRCQWHGACFNINNGDIEDFPGLDSLPCYQVTIKDNDDVLIRARKSQLESNKRTKTMISESNHDTNDEHFVIIGGGPAAATCVETLRQYGYDGKITMICKENYYPYDRVKVSKAMDFDINKAQFRTSDFYKNANINIIKGVEATHLDTDGRLIHLNDGQTIPFSKLFIATGMYANKPTNLLGIEFQNIITLRTYEDAVYTNSQLNNDKEVIILGSSFIAMEAANYCLNKVKKVTLIARDTVPFRYTLGEKIGLAFLNLYQQKGINFIPKSGIKKFLDKNNQGRVTHVELIDGQELKADLVILGIGAKFSTDFLKNSQLHLMDNGSIDVDEYLETNLKGIFAGGDIAYAPVWCDNNTKATIGHYPLAHYHGRIAAKNMIQDKQEPLKSVPYFWTMLFGKSVRYAGHGRFDDVIYKGDVDNFKFAAYYLRNNEVIAMSSCGMDPIVSQFAELLSQNKKLTKNDIITDESFNWTQKLKET